MSDQLRASINQEPEHQAHQQSNTTIPSKIIPYSAVNSSRKKRASFSEKEDEECGESEELARIFGISQQNHKIIGDAPYFTPSAARKYSLKTKTSSFSEGIEAQSNRYAFQKEFSRLLTREKRRKNEESPEPELIEIRSRNASQTKHSKRLP